MAVTITHDTDTTTLGYTADDDPQGYITQTLTTGRLESALTALGLPRYTQLAALDEHQRAELLTGTARLQAELHRRMLTLTVLCRDGGMSWASLASALTADPSARVAARRTYEAGLKVLGTTHTPSLVTYTWQADVTDTEDSETGGVLSGTVSALTEEDARQMVSDRLTRRGWRVGAAGIYLFAKATDSN